MKRNTLATIRRALETGTHEVTVDADVADGARRAVARMLDLSWSRGDGPHREAPVSHSFDTVHP